MTSSVALAMNTWPQKKETSSPKASAGFQSFQRSMLPSPRGPGSHLQPKLARCRLIGPGLQRSPRLCRRAHSWTHPAVRRRHRPPRWRKRRASSRCAPSERPPSFSAPWLPFSPQIDSVTRWGCEGWVKKNACPASACKAKDSPSHFQLTSVVRTEKQCLSDGPRLRNTNR